MIPGLVDKLETSLPENYKEKLKQKDTILNKVNFETAIANKKIQLKSADIDADGFLINGKGEAGFDLTYNIDGSFTIPRDFSASMVAIEEPLKYILNDEQMIYLPLKVTGKGTDVHPLPDVTYLTKRIIENKGKEQLLKVIDKAIGIKREPQAEQQPSGQDGQNAPSSQEVSPEREIIENIFNTIFK